MSDFYYERNQVLDDTGWDLEFARPRKWLVIGLGITLMLVALLFPYFQDKKEIDHLKAAVVFVKCEDLDSTGSGFFINSAGELLTNRHVVFDATSGRKSALIKVIVHSGTDEETELNATVVDDGQPKDKNVLGDWALLKLVGTPPYPLTHLSRAEAPTAYTEGDEVRAVGFPLGQELAVDEGGPKVSVRTGSVTQKEDNRILSKVGTDHGMSGGPLVLKGTTSVIGINTLVLGTKTDVVLESMDVALPIESLPENVLKKFGH